MSKGDKLEVLLNCSERISERLWKALENAKISHHKHDWHKVHVLNKANMRLTAKIADLLS